jgi:uncharacterized protein YndB with AHSA1/START domain
MRIVKYGLALFLVAVGLVFLIGWRLPESHEATVEREYAATPERVYQEIATPREYPRWRSGVQKVDILEAEDDGLERFREYALGDEVTYVIEEKTPGQRFVTTIADKDLPYGGSWIFEMTPSAMGTRLRITEEGEVYNAFFRFVSRFILGHTRGLETYHSDLEKRLAAPPGT